MRKLALALILGLGAVPAVAGTMTFDLPRLTWPATSTISGSTKGCELPITAPQPTEATVCK